MAYGAVTTDFVRQTGLIPRIESDFLDDPIFRTVAAIGLWAYVVVATNLEPA